jgi:hypothetical protein
VQQRTTRPTSNQPNRTTATQANRTLGNQTRPTNSQVNRATSQAGSGGQNNGSNNANNVVCRKCKSPQIVANRRGFSIAKVLKTLGWMVLFPIILLVPMALLGKFLSSSGVGEVIQAFKEGLGVLYLISINLALPVSIILGFVGSSEIVNGCMNCGFKWSPAKKK